MSKLLKYTENFECSQPVFRLQLSDDGDSIRVSEPINKYQPDPIEGDFLSELVCDAYSESFNPRIGQFRVDKNQIARSAMDNIRRFMRDFLDKNLPMRNPKQSKLYRWVHRNMANTDEINDGLVLIYQYIKVNSTVDASEFGKNEEHITNAIALLDAMRERYEEQA